MSNIRTYTRINEDFLDVRQDNVMSTGHDMVDDIMMEIRRMIVDDIEPSFNVCDLPDAYYIVDSREALMDVVHACCLVYGNECSLNWIDVSEITDMNQLFIKSRFNGDISRWDTGNVQNMWRMFYQAHFDGNISEWDVSRVLNMEEMFYYSNFCQDISNWNISEDCNVYKMFFGTHMRYPNDSYLPTVLNRTDKKIKVMTSIQRAFGFQGIGYGLIREDFLDVHQPSDYLKADDIIYEEVRAEIKKMQKDGGGDLYIPSINLCSLPDAYYRPDDYQELWNLVRLVPSTYGLDCNLNWIDVSGMNDLSYIFDGSGFDSDISRWNVSQAVNMSDMFASSAFNGNISHWDVRNVRYMDGMFTWALFNQDISDWDVQKVKTMREMFKNSQFKKATLLKKWKNKIKANCNTDEMFRGTPVLDDDGNPIILPHF